MTEKQKPYLTVVRADGEEPSAGVATEGERAGKPADDLVGQIVMHGATAWVVACMERDAHTVDVSRVGPGVFDAAVHLVGGGDVFLRVLTQLEAGPRLGIVVEPVHP
jgi:hypothetical protein